MFASTAPSWTTATLVSSQDVSKASKSTAEVWRAVAELTRSFVQVETQAFDLLES